MTDSAEIFQNFWDKNRIAGFEMREILRRVRLHNCFHYWWRLLSSSNLVQQIHHLS